MLLYILWIELNKKNFIAFVCQTSITKTNIWKMALVSAFFSIIKIWPLYSSPLIFQIQGHFFSWYTAGPSCNLGAWTCQGTDFPGNTGACVALLIPLAQRRGLADRCFIESAAGLLDNSEERVGVSLLVHNKNTVSAQSAGGNQLRPDFQPCWYWKNSAWSG